MSDVIHAYEFTGYVTNIHFFGDKFYITVEKPTFDAYSEPNHLIRINMGVEFWTTNLRDIYNAYSALIAKTEETFVFSYDQRINFWSLPEELK